MPPHKIKLYYYHDLTDPPARTDIVEVHVLMPLVRGAGRDSGSYGDYLQFRAIGVWNTVALAEFYNVMLMLWVPKFAYNHSMVTGKVILAIEQAGIHDTEWEGERRVALSARRE